MVSSVDSRLTTELLLSFDIKLFMIRQMENNDITYDKPTGMNGTVLMVCMACFVSNSYYLVHMVKDVHLFTSSYSYHCANKNILLFYCECELCYCKCGTGQQ